MDKCFSVLYTTAKIVLNGVKSDWAPVVSGVPQGTVLVSLLAHLSQRDIGELIVYPRRPSVVHLSSVRPSSSISSPLKPLGQSKPIFCGASLGRENESMLTASWSHDQDGHHAHIWSKPFKHLLLRNRRADFYET